MRCVAGAGDDIEVMELLEGDELGDELGLECGLADDILSILRNAR
jgi:hypothetical protein